jgi:hypothetical protein
LRFKRSLECDPILNQQENGTNKGRIPFRPSLEALLLLLVQESPQRRIVLQRPEIAV